jgi:protein TonB
LQGTVTLRVLVNEQGGVDQVEVVSGVDRRVLDRAAVRAAKRWTYEPASKDGVAVKVWIVQRVTFKL